MGLTQAQLAQKISTTPIAIERWENGETFPDINDLVLLADALSVSTDHLCGKKNEVAAASERKQFSRLNIIKYIVALIAAVAVFAGGFIIGADIKLKKENSRVYLPENVSVSNVSFSKRNGKLHYQFTPSVVGKGYKYKITFRDYADNEFSYEIPVSDSGCFGTATDLEATFIDTVAVTISSTDENRIIIVATNLQLDSDRVSWDSAKD